MRFIGTALALALAFTGPLGASTAEDGTVGEDILYGIDDALAAADDALAALPGANDPEPEPDPLPLGPEAPAPEMPRLPAPPATPPRDGPLQAGPLCDLDCRLAARDGDVEAMVSMARHHLDGWDGKKKNRIALRWFRRAAEKGHLEAMYAVGWMLSNISPPHEAHRIEARRWFTRAARKGHDQARLMLSGAQALRASTPVFTPRWYDPRP